MELMVIVIILSSVLLFASCKGTSSQNGKAGQTILSSSMQKSSNESDTIKQLMLSNTATIVDVRTPEEFAEGHIINSINIPLNTIADSLEVFKQYKNVIVVCRSGNRSAKAKAILQKNGFANIYDGKAWDSLNNH